MRYKKGSTALWAHVSVGFIGIEVVWSSWKSRTAQWMVLLWEICDFGANQGKDFPSDMWPKSLVRQKLMSKVDFCTKCAIVSVLSGYWVCLPGVEGGQSFIPYFLGHSCQQCQTWGWRWLGTCPAGSAGTASAATPHTHLGWAAVLLMASSCRGDGPCSIWAAQETPGAPWPSLSTYRAIYTVAEV